MKSVVLPVFNPHERPRACVAKWRHRVEMAWGGWLGGAKLTGRGLYQAGAPTLTSVHSARSPPFGTISPASAADSR